MASFLIVQKDGNIKETNVKNMKEEELYKKAGFRLADGFKLHASWTVENVKNKTYSIEVYGKTDGKANQENKYEFPPPIDNTLFFGSCLIVNKKGEQAGTGQPATRTLSKSEGSQKPQPEAEGRSR